MKSLGVYVRHCLHYPLRASITLTFHCKVATAKCCADSTNGFFSSLSPRFLDISNIRCKVSCAKEHPFSEWSSSDHLCHYPLNCEHEKWDLPCLTIHSISNIIQTFDQILMLVFKISYRGTILWVLIWNTRIHSFTKQVKHSGSQEWISNTSLSPHLIPWSILLNTRFLHQVWLHFQVPDWRGMSGTKRSRVLHKRDSCSVTKLSSVNALETAEYVSYFDPFAMSLSPSQCDTN